MGPGMGAERPIDPGPPSVRRTVQSFRYALNGIHYLVRTQPNFRVHVVVAVAVMVTAAALSIGVLEMAALVLVIGLVLVAEALNTALEAIVDLASPGYHPLAKAAKDASAGAVLLAAIVAVVVGLLILGPRLLIRVPGGW